MDRFIKKFFITFTTLLPAECVNVHHMHPIFSYSWTTKTSLNKTYIYIYTYVFGISICQNVQMTQSFRLKGMHDSVTECEWGGPKSIKSYFSALNTIKLCYVCTESHLSKLSSLGWCLWSYEE